MADQPSGEFRIDPFALYQMTYVSTGLITSEHPGRFNIELSDAVIYLEGIRTQMMYMRLAQADYEAWEAYRKDTAEQVRRQNEEIGWQGEMPMWAINNSFGPGTGATTSPSSPQGYWRRRLGVPTTAGGG